MGAAMKVYPIFGLHQSDLLHTSEPALRSGDNPSQFGEAAPLSCFKCRWHDFTTSYHTRSCELGRPQHSWWNAADNLCLRSAVPSVCVRDGFISALASDSDQMLVGTSLQGDGLVTRHLFARTCTKEDQSTEQMELCCV